MFVYKHYKHTLCILAVCAPMISSAERAREEETIPFKKSFGRTVLSPGRPSPAAAYREP